MTTQDYTSGLPSIPSGYVLGRTDNGTGAPQLISVSDLAASVLNTKGRPYPIGFSWPGGVPGNSQRIGDHVFSIGVTFPPNFSAYTQHASQASGSANATGSTVFSIKRNGSQIGTITIGAGTTTPTFATSGGVAQRYAQGDKITIFGPATADATFADPCFTLVGYES